MNKHSFKDHDDCSAQDAADESTVLKTGAPLADRSHLKILLDEHSINAKPEQRGALESDARNKPASKYQNIGPIGSGSTTDNRFLSPRTPMPASGQSTRDAAADFHDDSDCRRPRHTVRLGCVNLLRRRHRSRHRQTCSRSSRQCVQPERTSDKLPCEQVSAHAGHVPHRSLFRRQTEISYGPRCEVPLAQ